MAHGQITHIEFPADDTARARRFYGELFGWQFGELEGSAGYYLFNTGAAAQAGGAIGERDKSTGRQLRIYVECDSIEELLPRVDELGGRVVEGRTEIPGQGWYAVVVDPEGSEIGLFEGPAELIVALVDSHAHLQAEAFAGDTIEVVAAARLAGVAHILAPGWDLASSRASLDLSDAGLADAAVGVHPHVAATATDDDWRGIEELAADGRVLAVGETGLDYDRGFSPREAQLANLRRHLDLGRRLAKPVILHCRSKPGQRDAQDELLRELADAGAGTPDWPTADGRPPALLHSFSGPVDYAEQAVAMGLAVSFSGLVFRAGEEASRQVARLVPEDRLLVETDSPYLSPPGGSRRRNEPQWVTITAAWLAERRGVGLAVLGDRLVTNYRTIFGARVSG